MQQSLSPLDDALVLGVLLAILGFCVVISVTIALVRFATRKSHDLSDEWSDAVEHVKKRRESLAQILDSKADAALIQQNSEFELAAIDLFVEKAQAMLTRRGDDHRWLGIFTSWLVFEILLAAIVALLWLALHGAVQPRWEDVVIRIATTASIAGILLGAAFFMSALARAHLHEATTLYNRRHMVRAGRLFLYLKFLSDRRRPLRKAKNRLTVQDMEHAFGGLRETSTAFKDIKSEVLTSTWLGQLTQAIARTRTSVPIEP
jgi:hypothetical protein